jgi:hypothetical protein
MSARWLYAIGRFAFKVVMAQPTGKTQKKLLQVEWSEALFVLGLTTFTVGVAFAIGWPWALVAGGVVLMGIGLFSAIRSG